MGDSDHQFSMKSRGKKKKATNSKRKFQLMHDPAYLDRAETANSASLPVFLRPKTRGERRHAFPPQPLPEMPCVVKGLDASDDRNRRD